MTRHPVSVPYAARLSLGLLLGVALPRATAAGDKATLQLANDLERESDHRAAAIEYRRLALSEPDAKRRAGYYWAAAYQYHRAGATELAEKMLDRTEDASEKLASESLMLRAEVSFAAHRPDRTEFYLTSAARKQTTPESRRLTGKRLAAARLLKNDVGGAERALRDAPSTDPGRAALAAYRDGSRRIPAVGGMLGIIPGLGYAYSGEYANALRSLILNGIFIYAMAETAADEEWGAFAAVTFFELTWYTGSIYGGIDAAHRYNRQRLDRCLEAIGGNSGFEPDLEQIPVISLRFIF